MPKFPFASAAILALIVAGPLPGQAASPTTGTAAADSPATLTYTLRAVPFTDVKLDGGFWGPRVETNRKVSLPHSLDMAEKAGNLKNLQLAIDNAKSGFEGWFFLDSDLYKAIEAVSYSLAAHPDPALEQRLGKIIDLIARAQRPDGYLNTFNQVMEPEKRWANLRDKHELYCAGHLMEAAVAHYRATGSRKLLDVAIKFADYIDSVFGSEPGKRMGYPGHEEIELALFKLWQVTGNERYFKLSQFFLESRGKHFFATEHKTPLEKYNGEYWQDNVPLREHKKMVGHAVRAAYLLSGATDYAAVTHDPALLSMLDTVWHNTNDANMYITGGIGSSAKNEGFTTDYDLPNDSAYQETCASVAMIMWNHRLNLLSGDSKYADSVERTLYNGFLAGVSLDGKKFFYVNPLSSNGKHHREEWFGCACCPPNVTRTLAQLGGYAYATSPGALWVNLFMQGRVNTTVDGRAVSMDVSTDYPWIGSVQFRPTVADGQPLELRIRVPEWCTSTTLLLNGQPVAGAQPNGGYLAVKRPWYKGDSVVLQMDMPVRQVAADPRVTADRGRLAILRGPLVYCLEAADNPTSVPTIAIAPRTSFTTKRRENLLGDVVTVSGTAQVAKRPGASSADDRNRSSRLYKDLPETEPVRFTAIPYFAWDNRTAGPMAVWVPAQPE